MSMAEWKAKWKLADSGRTDDISVNAISFHGLCLMRYLPPKRENSTSFYWLCVSLFIVLFDLICSAEMEPSALLVRQGLYRCPTVLGRRNDLCGASVTLISDHLQLHYEIGTHNRILLFPIFLLLKIVLFFPHIICSDYGFPSLSSSEIIITLLEESLNLNFLTISKHFLKVFFPSGCFSLPWVMRILLSVFVLIFLI